jgi:prolyl 4-hydroxylase
MRTHAAAAVALLCCVAGSEAASASTVSSTSPRTSAEPRRRLLFGRLFKTLFNRTGSSWGGGADDGGNVASCGDAQIECKEWASKGECEANPGFMQNQCARSCGLCNGVRTKARPSPRDCRDEAGFECTTKAAAGECDSNKGEMIYRCPQSCGVCHMWGLVRDALGCDDLNDNCATWARSGECQGNPLYMSENCPVACRSCEAKRSSCDRPPGTPPTVRKGEINQTFVRLLRDFPQYHPTALSWPGGPKGRRAPWVVALDSFLSDEEAAAFTSTCEEHFERSLAGDQLSPVRTSSQCWCSSNACERHDLTRRVGERIANLTRSEVRYFEPFQVLRYEPGQFYRVHHDQNSGRCTPQGPRVYTFFMYLSTPTAGGGTRFPNLGVTVPAVKGHAVLWPSIMDENPDRDEPMTVCARCPSRRPARATASSPSRRVVALPRAHPAMCHASLAPPLLHCAVP